MRHLTNLFDVSRDEVLSIFKLAADLKAQLKAGERSDLLSHKVLTMIFDKPSLRTRLSFEAAMIQLGGHASFFSAKDVGLYGRESLPDVARVASSMSDAIVLRTFSHSTVEDFVTWSSCPIINGLSDDFHPCQALTDLFTLQEVFGGISGQHIVFVGDGNNVATSLLSLCAKLDVRLTLACPRGYEIPDHLVAAIRKSHPNVKFEQTQAVADAVKSADVVYTDVWVSMGQESEAETRKRQFTGFQVNSELMALAPKHACFMHDLPARRGLEVSDDVMDGKQSVVFQQAENRMHLAKGILVWLLGEKQSR
jgi:ornithine carbamoyltransferase